MLSKTLEPPSYAKHTKRAAPAVLSGVGSKLNYKFSAETHDSARDTMLSLWMHKAKMSSQEFSIFLEPYNAVYIDIAKVASSSLKAAFASVLGLDLDRVGGNPHEVEYRRPPAPNRSGERLYPGLYTFAFVRNPWDRLVSCYRDKIQGQVTDFTLFSQSGVARCLARFDAFSADMSFEAFVYAVASIPDAEADEHFRSQHKFLTNDRGEIAVDFVGRSENLEADFQYVAERIGLPKGISLPRLQANPRAIRYTVYYTVATRDIVAVRFAQDIALFSYQFR